jgi:hypothetical protein
VRGGHVARLPSHPSKTNTAGIGRPIAQIDRLSCEDLESSVLRFASAVKPVLVLVHDYVPAVYYTATRLRLDFLVGRGSCSALCVLVALFSEGRCLVG